MDDKLHSKLDELNARPLASLDPFHLVLLSTHKIDGCTS
jgi:hypothetical protein